MRNSKLISMTAIQVVSILVALILTSPVMAECIQSAPVAADTVLAIDANNGCGDIQGQEGCYIAGKNLDGGTCTSSDGKFTVHSKYNGNGDPLSWWLSADSEVGIDTVVVPGGSRGKNVCGYVFNSDVVEGSGGDCKGDIVGGVCDGVIQNITGLHVCSDGKDDVAPPPPEVASPLPSCSATGYRLDDTGIDCPKYSAQDVIDAQGAYELCLEENAADTSVCLEPTFVADQEKPVVVCNLEKDKENWGTTDGSDVCCQCGIPEEKQTACVVTEEEIPGVNECTQSMTVNPTQSVELMFFKDDEDPCTWIKTRKGWLQYCY